MSKAELLNLLKTSRDETMGYFILPEADMDKTYGEGKWSIRQILHHLTDVEVLFIGRFKKIMAEPKQVIWAFNQEEWNTAFDYRQAPLDGKQELYRICRDENYRLIENYYETFEQKEFVHNETGLRTLKMEFEKIGLHNQTHNEQIIKALMG